jgi:hypothetical protein
VLGLTPIEAPTPKQPARRWAHTRNPTEVGNFDLNEDKPRAYRINRANNDKDNRQQPLISDGASLRSEVSAKSDI